MNTSLKFLISNVRSTCSFLFENRLLALRVQSKFYHFEAASKGLKEAENVNSEWNIVWNNFFCHAKYDRGPWREFWLRSHNAPCLISRTEALLDSASGSHGPSHSGSGSVTFPPRTIWLLTRVQWSPEDARHAVFRQVQDSVVTNNFTLRIVFRRNSGIQYSYFILLFWHRLVFYKFIVSSRWLRKHETASTTQ